MSIDTVTDPYIAGTKVGSTLTLEIGFPYEDLSEVKVLVKTTRWIQGVLGTHYTITAQTVTITDTDATKAIVYRDTALTQLTGFSPEDDFTPQLYEAALDKLTRIAQDQQELIDRSVKLETKQDGFTPVIKGEVPVGAIITRGVDKTDADGEDERGHLTAGDYSLGSLAADKEAAEDAATSAVSSKEMALMRSLLSKMYAYGLTSSELTKLNELYAELVNPNFYFTSSLKSASDYRVESEKSAGEASADAAEAATKLLAIESITGRIADPSDVHHVLNIEQYVETASLFAYGDKLTRDFNTETGPNQLYWDTTSVKGFPKAEGANDDADEPKIEARAYIIERWAKDSLILNGADLTTYGPEQFITQIKSIVTQSVAQKGATLERVLEKKVGLGSNTKRGVYYQTGTQNGNNPIVWSDAAYKCNGTEINWISLSKSWVIKKLWDFGLATEGVTRSKRVLSDLQSGWREVRHDTGQLDYRA